MIPQLQYFWKEGLSLQSKNGWRMRNIMTVLLKPIAEEAGGYSELPANLLQKFH